VGVISTDASEFETSSTQKRMNLAQLLAGFEFRRDSATIAQHFQCWARDAQKPNPRPVGAVEIIRPIIHSKTNK
jgi:hypothetical protein